MPGWLADALLFLLLAAVLYSAIGFLAVIALNRYLLARQMAHIREPVRRFGVERARPLFREMEETGRAPAELEPLLAELRERG